MPATIRSQLAQKNLLLVDDLHMGVVKAPLCNLWMSIFWMGKNPQTPHSVLSTSHNCPQTHIPLDLSSSHRVPVCPDCIPVGTSHPTERQKTCTHPPELIVILPDGITICRPRTVTINQGYRYLGNMGFQEQSPDFLRLAEYHSVCSRCYKCV